MFNKISVPHATETMLPAIDAGSAGLLKPVNYFHRVVTLERLPHGLVARIDQSLVSLDLQNVIGEYACIWRAQSYSRSHDQ
ncbi:MAG: hypothetical protein PVJ75_03580 [Chloroflexota bacterium]|jgi:hypothetical protein